MTRVEFGLLMSNLLDRYMLGDRRMPSNNRRIISSASHCARKDRTILEVSMKDGQEFEIVIRKKKA